MADRALKVAVVASEESGDLLGADLVRALQRATGKEIGLVGLGGRHLQALGLKSLFDSSEVALMGIGAVLRDLPRLLRRIGQTAAAISEEQPDCLITIDSPDFSLRVAKKVRALNPAVPIVHYVCPSVWAWRPGRAPAMRPYVDRVLCILPFEVKELERLSGPPGTYVGHRLTHDPGILGAAAAQAAPRDLSEGREKTLLVLPGSRRSEVKRLIGPFGEVVSILRQRGHAMRLLLPSVPHVADMVRESVSRWDGAAKVILDASDKWRAFGKADAALIASGTVSLELALAGVPMLSCYRFDPVSNMAARRFITAWSGALPNLIADKPLVTELYNEYVRPVAMARTVEALWSDTHLRHWQRDGFSQVAKRMETPRPAGEMAAEAVLETMRQLGSRR